jgi:hypothetical protein
MTRTTLEKSEFDAALYWANKPIKKFVVTLFSRRENRDETRIFAASCSDRASELALANSDLIEPVIREVRLATPEDLGAELVTHDPVTEVAKNCGLTKFVLPGMASNMFLLGNAPAMAAVQQLQQQHQRLSGVLADCLSVFQACEKHSKLPAEWPSPINTMEWDVTVRTAALALKEVQHGAVK